MIFEKATRQHHFIGMYVDLCKRIEAWTAESNIFNAANKESFKRILLNQCQSSFEKYLNPPDDLDSISDAEEKLEKETKYKEKMLGNVKLVGQLLIAGILSAKVRLKI